MINAILNSEQPVAFEYDDEQIKKVRVRNK